MIQKKTIYIFVISALLILFLFHIKMYFFQCDDAFISYRYADNLAEGHGPVFNPGERVEGYTNFLWVLILSLFSLLGIQPEIIAPILSIIAAVSLYGLFVYYNYRHFARSNYDIFTLIAPLFLVTNRSFAVWATGGLETRLFSLFIFIAIMTLILNKSENGRPLIISALFFSLASLTRPEGILLFGCFFGFYFIRNFKNRNAVRNLIYSLSIFIVLIGSHFIFRYFYYGYPFPNTFYAKVSRAWWSSGLIYIFTFFHEYGIYLLIPPAFLIFSKYYDAHKRSKLIQIILPFAPYLIYLIYLGGDHFEFRPIDILIPFIAILIQESLRAAHQFLSEYKRQIKIAWAVYGLLFLFLHITPSLLSHLTFPEEYQSATTVATSSGKSPANKIPILNSYLKVFDNAHRKLTENFICIRQEEHKLALQQVFLPQAKMLKEAVEHGIIKANDKISLWCVGAIPYYSGLYTIDYLGLTDEYIAHTKLPDIPDKLLPFKKLMAHQKRASWDYLKKREVAYIATNPSRFFVPRENFIRDGELIEEKIPDNSYLIEMGKYFFLYKSVFIPEYFAFKFSGTDISCLHKNTEGEIFIISDGEIKKAGQL